MGRRAASAFLAGEEPQLGSSSRGQTLPRLDAEHHQQSQHPKRLLQHSSRISKAHEAGRSAFAEFLWQDREVYRQRTWLCRLARRFAEEKETADVGSPFIGTTQDQREHHLGGKKNRRRKAALARMTPGSTLMSIGEAADSFHAPNAPQRHQEPVVEVKAWPAFRAYKTLIASAQVARQLQKRPTPIVVRAGKAPVKTAAPPTRKGIATTAATPTLARIVASAQSTRMSSPLLGVPRGPAPKASGMDPLFPLHLARLAVIDGEESRACDIFERYYGLTRSINTQGSSDAPLKAVLLGKPKAWPVLLRIWLRALDRGMDELLLMLLGAGITANALQPISFVAPKKAPPNPAPRFYSLAGLASSVSLLSTGSGSTAAMGALGDWLQRSYRHWLLHRLPSFFLAAVAFGRIRLVRAMLEAAKRQASALTGSAAAWLGLTPLCVAAASGLLALPKCLLDAGADPAIGLPYYNWLLARRKLCRRQGPSQRAQVISDEALTWIKEAPLFPLDCAVAKGNSELFLLLLSRSHVPASSKLALLVQQELDLSIKILKAGISHPSIADPFGNRPLHYAAHNGQVDLVALYLHYGAPIDATNALGRTALHLAALQGCSGALRCLLQAGADCSIRDAAGQTALEAARRHGFDSEQLADYLQSARPEGSDATKALIEQVENYDLREDLSQYSDRPPANLPQPRPAQQRKGRFLIEKIINPRQWWA